MVTESQKRAKARYDAKTVQYVFRFRLGADADVIERLRSVPEKTSYIRRLIRNDISSESARG